MKDPYAFGFYSACFALMVVVAATYYSAASGTHPVRTADAYFVIYSASSLIEALAVIGIAGVAFKAYGSWKQDVRQHKALGVIWDASVAFREIEIGFNEWFFGPNAELKAGNNVRQIDSLLSASPLGLALRAFKKQCILLDKVVIKSHWRWLNHAAELEMLARALSAEAFGAVGKGKVTHTIVDFLYVHEGEAWQRTQADWETLMTTIEEQLTTLEETYT
ncbi:hypothetical protein [Pseudomonas cichorii]|uniref:SMODS and SLOG-associating 2TM effector domain-containing protein n=1 Tax=Pseudomonas cichorii TaxID=36746 RepID=A0ABQ1DR85_PSECI|nr:hypothetical protein [Pseudomonas cichorii]AHF66254.1 hypothetical protein PCH70_11010 [Pseudomonas cichorii JBC1]QVE18209.1 hypothetical protein KGD89_05480 [Pseudomonas cichorii]SDO71832.1 hypothetical protein SAMN05216599_11260 [Pseudomonas cichorii]GFM74876.1 hypothetical protein PSCICM_06950 [Pseudomonas cichorii]GFM93539.1 hypothetical protein PSCICP_35110 [Pseudomonas cichorii]